jgi:hypothetical protein
MPHHTRDGLRSQSGYLLWIGAELRGFVKDS